MTWLKPVQFLKYFLVWQEEIFYLQKNCYTLEFCLTIHVLYLIAARMLFCHSIISYAFLWKKIYQGWRSRLKAREIIMGKFIIFVFGTIFFCVKDLNIVLTCACIVQNCILVIKNCQTILTNICMCQLNSSLFLLETVLL